MQEENTKRAYPKIGAENVWVASGHQKDALDTFAQQLWCIQVF